MKMTEVGWIPKDWEVKKVSDVATNSTGLTYSPDDVSSYGTLVLRSSNIQNDVLAFEDNVFVLMDIPERAIAHTGDILVCVRNGSRALIGKSAPITEKADGMAFGAFMTVLRATDITPQYLLYAWRSNIIQEQINATLGATINQITNADLKTFDVPLPTSPSEQRRIAQVLSDTDSLIASLSRTIEKKRLVKQGAMQQLLTGKTRLKGFRGEWVEKELGEVVYVLDNKRLPLNDSQRKHGIYPYCGANGIVDYIDDYIFDEELILMAEDGGNFGDYETRPIAYIMQGKYWVNNHAHVLKAREEYCQRFIYHSIAHKNITDLIIGGTRAKLNQAVLKGIGITMPPTFDEQFAIANILTTMDNEIASLEAELQKYKALKQGMMQKLLTGQIRLK